MEGQDIKTFVLEFPFFSSTYTTLALILWGLSFECFPGAAHCLRPPATVGTPQGPESHKTELEIQFLVPQAKYMEIHGGGSPSHEKIITTKQTP